MATCPKCGKHPIHKMKDKRRKCTRCGFLPNNMGYDRSGNLPPKSPWPPFPLNTEINLKRADWIVLFIRKNGVVEAVQNAWIIGETPDDIVAFVERNADAIYSPFFPDTPISRARKAA